MLFFMDLYDSTTRVYRPLEHPFDIYLPDSFDIELRKRYRFDKESILYLTNLIRAKLETDTCRGKPIPPEVKVMLALRFLASNSHQITVSDGFNINQASVSRAVHQVVDLLAAQIGNFVHFPADPHKLQHGFYSFAEFPQVIGAIDGTHILIHPPKDHEDDYVNRKGSHKY